MQIDNLLLSQVGSVPDAPVTTESPVSTDREGGIFSTLLLLALIGNSGAGTGTPFLNPSPQGDEKGGDAPENSPVQLYDNGLEKPTAPQFESDMSWHPQLLNDVSIPDVRFPQIAPAVVISLAKTYSNPSLHLDGEGQLQRSPDAAESEIQVSVNQENGLAKEDENIGSRVMGQGSWVISIPLAPSPLTHDPLKEGFSGETLMLHGNTKDNKNPPPLNPLPTTHCIWPSAAMGTPEGRLEGVPSNPPPLMGGGEGEGEKGEGEGVDVIGDDNLFTLRKSPVTGDKEIQILPDHDKWPVLTQHRLERFDKATAPQSEGTVPQRPSLLESDNLLTLQKSPDTGDREIQMSADQKKGPILMQHGLDENISPLSEELRPIAGPFKDGDKQDNFNNKTNNKGDRGWIGETVIGTFVMKDPVYMDTDTKLQPFHKSIDQEKILQQLSQRLIHAPHPGTHTARIRLKPEELGELCLDISVIDNKVRAVISVDNYDVKEIIEGNLNRLEGELKNHGLQIEQFTVEMNGGGPGDGFMSSTYRGEIFNKRGFSRVSEDNMVNQEGLDPVTMDVGVISIFA